MGFISVLSLAVFLSVAGLGVNGTADTSVSSQNFYMDFIPFDYDEPFDTMVQNSVSSISSVNGNTTESVQVLGSEYAIGKVYNKQISPYSAGLSWDNIYIKNSTGLNIDLKAELAQGSKIKIKDTTVPQVLIVHTHATESFMSGQRDYYTEADIFNTTDNSKNVIRLGNIVADILQKGGIGVIHDTTLHDHPQYSGSYQRAEQTINEILKKYPTIKIVLDIHRDSISQNSTDRVRPVTVVNGKEAAQVMLVMGSNTGNVSGFDNWRENFRLAIQYQQNLESMYPSLARAMTFASKKYNQHLTTGSMLLEIGADTNTLQQAEYSAELAANALLKTLNSLR